MNDKGYLVVIEWDGMKPPTAFYHRVRRLTSGVRQDDSEEERSISPFSRRSNHDNRAVIMQEGAIYCMSRSLARALALLAEEYGAASVEVATVSDMSPVVATAEDIESLSKINKVLGRRGRPPHGGKSNVYITCFDEILTSHMQTVAHDTINCPSCGSMSISVHYKGHKDTMGTFTHMVEQGKTLYDIWIISRTWNTHGIMFPTFISVPETVKNYDFDKATFVKTPYHAYGNMKFNYGTGNTGMYGTKQRDILRMMEASDLDCLDAFYAHLDDVIRILDAIFISRYIYSEEEQQEGRLSAISAVMVRYPEVAGDYMLTKDNRAVDFFDAATVIPTREMVDYFTKIYVHQKQTEKQLSLA